MMILHCTWFTMTGTLVLEQMMQQAEQHVIICRIQQPTQPCRPRVRWLPIREAGGTPGLLNTSTTAMSPNTSAIGSNLESMEDSKARLNDSSLLHVPLFTESPSHVQAGSACPVVPQHVVRVSLIHALSDADESKHSWAPTGDLLCAINKQQQNHQTLCSANALLWVASGEHWTSRTCMCLSWTGPGQG